MGFMDKVKNLMGVADDEYYEDEDMELFTKSEEQEESAPAQEAVVSPSKKNNKVVNIHATTQLQVVLVKPERFEDAGSVADHLNAKRTVVPYVILIVEIY